MLLMQRQPCLHILGSATGFLLTSHSTISTSGRKRTEGTKPSSRFPQKFGLVLRGDGRGLFDPHWLVVDHQDASSVTPGTVQK
jgi:hypothetical protein